MPSDLSPIFALEYSPSASADMSSLRKIHAEGADPAILQIMRNLYLFADVDETLLASVAARSSVVAFPAGTVVVAEGDESNGEAYVIVSGKVAVSIGGETVSNLGKGEIFGEYALVSSDARTATVTVAEPTECLVLDEAACVGISNETSTISDVMLQRIEENAEKGR
jgi:CRP-like cAMP-binding protein